MARLEELTRQINGNKRLRIGLKAVSAASAYAGAILFGIQLVLLLIDSEYIALAKAAGAFAIGFVAVTVFRKLINAPRPYEIRDIYEVAPRGKRGESFPSRHAYSVFAIAVLLWLWHPAAFAAGLVLGTAICVSRVLLGIHFIRDVVCGAAIGIITGIVGILTVVL